VDSTLDTATARAASEVSTFLASGTSKRLHIQSMYVPEAPIRIYGANIVGSDYDKANDVDNSIIAAENPHENVDGWPMLDRSMVINPVQEYYENHQETRGGDMLSPIDEEGNPCYVDLPIYNHGSSLQNSRYQPSPNVMGQFTSGKRTFLVLRIGVEGSPHRAHRTWVSTWCRNQGSHNGGLYRNVRTPTQSEKERMYINSHFGRKTIGNTENSGVIAEEGSVAQNNGLYLAAASGWGFGTAMASYYGSWIMLPYYGTNQYPTVRLYNWGFGDLYVSAVGVAYGDFVPAS